MFGSNASINLLMLQWIPNAGTVNITAADMIYF